MSVHPYGDPACSPDGRLVFTPLPDDVYSYDETLAVGEHYRSSMTLMSLQGKDMVLSAEGTAVRYGTADDCELVHLDWMGRPTRVARWAGPDLTVTNEDVTTVALYELVEPGG